MIMIKVHMHAGQDLPVVVVLNIGQLARQVTYMVVIDECDGPNGFFIRIPLLSDQVVADQVTQRFRPIGVLATFDMAIEGVQQLVIERHAEPD